MPTKGMIMTEMQKLKIKKTKGVATPADLERLKVLQDGEPLSATDLKNAKEREEKRAQTDLAAYEAKRATATVSVSSGGESIATPVDTSLDQPAEHPRIVKMKEALLPFTQIEAHESRPNEFVLFTRGISITAGDVRKARQAMKI